MKIQGHEAVSVGANIFTYVLSALQTNQVFQIIELVCSVCLTLLIFAYRLWKWLKEAKADGKIDKNEIEQLGEIVEDTKEELDKHKEDKK